MGTCRKPGWIRMSVHPIMTDEETDHILDVIEAVYHHHSTGAGV